MRQPDSSTFTLLYRTDWESCALRLRVDGGTSRFLGPPSRAHEPSAAQASGAVQFCVHNGNGQWDNPGSVAGVNYVAQQPGTYRLHGSQLLLLPPRLPVLLVSDLDGTLVGDEPALRAFAAYWAGTAAVAGSKLVYSTGRSLPSFLELSAKGGEGSSLPRPDALVCSVGTKVYLPQPGWGGKAGGWTEDGAWSARLDEGWDLGVMRDIAHAALDAVGHSEAHWRPEAEQNEHKLTLGVREGRSAEALAEAVRRGAAARGLSAKVVASGTGGWRYLDVVSAQAGKLESLEYVREALGFGSEATLAAGDSGNDILLLSGRSRGVVVGNAQPDLAAWAAVRTGRACALGPAGGAADADAGGGGDGGGGGGGDDGGGGGNDGGLSLSAWASDVAGGRAMHGGVGPVWDVELLASPTDSDPGPFLEAASQAGTALATAEDVGAGAEAEAERLYVARAAHAWGVVEGLQHFGWA